MDALQRRQAVVKPGDVVEGRYRIIRPLGEGGMGSVFLAEHTLISRRVAMKFLHPDLATDAIVVERFMNEARAAGTLGHPNIVESTDMGFIDNPGGAIENQVPYIAFEYLEGTLLTDEIYRTGGLPVGRAVRIATQIASALYAAHNAGIIHRDLKSDNVFLTEKGDTLDHVKVLDFGISRFTMQEDRQKNMVMGTPEFMAPEQIVAPDTVDKRADIYALGVILYETLSARRPFSSDDARQILHRIVHDAPPPLRGGDIPPGLAELIVNQLLAKNPDDRPPTMSDVEAALALFDGRAHAPTRPTRVKRRREPFPASELAERSHAVPATVPTKRLYAAYAVAAVSMAFGAAGLVVGLRHRGPLEPSLEPPPPQVGTEPTPAARVALRFDADAPKAQILVRHRRSPAPMEIQVAPMEFEELVEISAPNRKTVRYWLTFDRPLHLRAQLPKGSGSVEATAAETQAALRAADGRAPVTAGTSAKQQLSAPANRSATAYRTPR